MATAESRHNLALHHLLNARHAARQCREREADLASLKYRLAEVELDGAEMVAVMSSLAFIKAVANEVYLDAVDPLASPDRLEGMAAEAIEAMNERWNAAERLSVLKNYTVVLGLSPASRHRPPGPNCRRCERRTLAEVGEHDPDVPPGTRPEPRRT